MNEDLKADILIVDTFCRTNDIDFEAVVEAVGKNKQDKRIEVCFFCSKRLSKTGMDNHYSYGPDEFPVCINGKKGSE